MDNNLIAFSTDAENKGYKNLNYEGKPGSNSVTATWGDYNDSYAFDTSGLTNIDGKLYGTREQLDNIFAAPKTQVRGVANSQGVNVGYDRNNNPILNGQTISTNGMINNGGHWYGDQKQVQQIVNNAKPAEYVNPYDDQTNSLLRQLLNYKSFNYNPNQDKDLQTAMKFARVQAMQDAVERGQGNSTGMEWAASQAANNLIPQYRQQALDIYNADRGYLKDLLGEARALKTVAADEYKMLEDLYNQNKTQHNDAIRTDIERAATEADIRQGDRSLDIQEDSNEITREELKEKVREFNLKYDQEERTLEQSAKEFAETMKFNREQFSEEMAYNWARHRLDGMQYVSDQEKEAANRALQATLAIGYVTEEAEKYFGIPAGTKTLDWMAYELDKDTADWQKKKYEDGLNDVQYTPTETTTTTTTTQNNTKTNTTPKETQGPPAPKNNNNNNQKAPGSGLPVHNPDEIKI